MTNASLRSPFFSPAFAQTVAGLLGARVRVQAIREGGAPVAFLPYQMRPGWQGASGIAERVGGEFSDYFGLVAREASELPVAELLGDEGPACLMFSHLPEAQLGFGFPGEDPEAGLKVLLTGGSAAFLQDFQTEKKKLHSNLLRCQRNLERDFGPLRFEFDTPSKIDRLNHVLDRKIAQYQRTDVYDQLAIPEQQFRDLLFGFLNSKSRTCKAVISELYAGNTWISSHFGLRCDEVLHYWFPVYNDDLRKYAPGSLLLLKIIQAADDEGIGVIDRGAGKSKAKEDFANHEHLFYRGVWIQNSLKGKIAHSLLRLHWKIQ